MAIGELRATIKPRWNVIKINVPNRWLFSVFKPSFVEGL